MYYHCYLLTLFLVQFLSWNIPLIGLSLKCRGVNFLICLTLYENAFILPLFYNNSLAEYNYYRLTFCWYYSITFWPLCRYWKVIYFFYCSFVSSVFPFWLFSLGYQFFLSDLQFHYNVSSADLSFLFISFGTCAFLNLRISLILGISQPFYFQISP